MSNILVTGSNGQLGSELKDLSSLYPDYNFIFTDIAKLDICNHNAVKEFIVKNVINTIINCAAYTDVDKAEKKFELSNDINNLAVKNIANIVKEYHIKLIHISTNYVFDGINHFPYKETDKPNPQSVYGTTKLAGENEIRDINPNNTIIIRTSWVYSSYGNNFLKTMLRLGSKKKELRVIVDQIGTPTYGRDLAKTILEIIPNIVNKNVEIYHYSNEGVCSWYDFAKAIFQIAGLKLKVNPIETYQYPAAAIRPSYSVLNKSKIKLKFQKEIPFWKDSLIQCLKKINCENN